MNRTSFRRALVPTLAAVALAATACGGSSGNSLNGAGSTAQQKAQEAWTTAFQGQNKNLTINYNAIGSGDGRKQFEQGGVDFAGSDSYLKDDATAGTHELTDAKNRCGSDPIEVPDYVSPIAVIYNLPGVTDLKLDASTMAKIFDGKITKWNDPAIAALNSGTNLPSTAIAPVHRQDDSGTTNNFTDYLGKAASSDWSYPASNTFPVQGGLAAEGTSGVVAAVKNGAGTIGYADESQAGGLSQAQVKVGSSFVAPTPAAAAKVVALSTPVAGRPAVDMAVDIDRTTTEAGAYPIVLVSYLIACQTYSNSTTADNVKNYLGYIVSDAGQQAAASAAGSAPLDPALAKKAQAIVAAIKAK